MSGLTEAQLAALREFHATSYLTPYGKFPEGKMRDDLRKLGCIERWNPSLKYTGKRKPWRITAFGYQALDVTPAGRTALSDGGGK